MNPTVFFPARYLRQLMPFIAEPGEVRYYLTGLNVRPAPGGCVLVATNGHCMMLVYVSGGICEHEDGVTLKISNEAAKCARISDAFVSFSGEDGRLKVVRSGDFSMSYTDAANHCHNEMSEELYVNPGVATVSGKFPDYKKVLPVFADLKQEIKSAFCADYIKQFASVAPKRSAMILWQAVAHGPIAVQYDDMREVMGVIMPMRPKSMADIETYKVFYPDEFKKERLPA